MNIRSEKPLSLIKPFFAALFILLTSLTALGQDAENPATPRLIESQSAELKIEAARLLQSTDSKDRAWAAYLIGKQNLRDYIPSLVELLAPASPDTSPGNYLVNRVALDSLIQLDAEVSPDRLMPLLKYFTNEVVILMAKSPEANRKELLTLAETFKSGTAWTAVCNLLTEIKAAGFARYLLKDLQVNVSVYVSDSAGMGGGSGIGCGASVGCGGAAAPYISYPPMFYYKLTDCGSRGAVVIAPGKHTIYYQRTPDGVTKSGYCASTSCLSGERLEYLASLLNTTEQDLRLDNLSYHIQWRGLQDYKIEMAQIRIRVKYLYQGMINRLMENSLLTVEEAETIKPNISYYVGDYRNNKSVALPGAASQ